MTSKMPPRGMQGMGLHDRPIEEHHGKKSSNDSTPMKPSDKMKKTMDEFVKGELHSGSKSGPKVTNKKQAVAIGLSQEKKEKGK